MDYNSENSYNQTHKLSIDTTIDLTNKLQIHLFCLLRNQTDIPHSSPVITASADPTINPSNNPTSELQVELIQKLYPSSDKSIEKKKTISTHDIPVQLDDMYDVIDSVNSFEWAIYHDIKTLTEHDIQRGNRRQRYIRNWGERWRY
eukprot:813098_1